MGGSLSILRVEHISDKDCPPPLYSVNTIHLFELIDRSICAENQNSNRPYLMTMSRLSPVHVVSTLTLGLHRHGLMNQKDADVYVYYNRQAAIRGYIDLKSTHTVMATYLTARTRRCAQKSWILRTL